jgi:GDP-4-dehydro-6-deoxy-D-mannose reductase
MRVLITGGSGFVGTHLKALLMREGEDVVTWGLAEAPGQADVGIDLCDGAAVRARDMVGFDVVIHLAGLADVGRSFSEPAAYVSANSAMEINLFEALVSQHVFPRVLVVSTGAVYGGASGLINEDTRGDVTSPYAVSKLTQELLGSYYGKRGFEVIIARPFNHIGPGQRHGYLVADLASQIAAAERDGHGTVTVGDLTSARDYTDVRDIAAAYSCLIRGGRPGEIYNICSGASHTGEEIVGRLLELSTADVTLARSSALTRPVDASVVTASNQKLRQDTAWSPTIPLSTTLRDTLDYWRSVIAASPLS